jgi:hypothetical protein
MPDAAIIDRRGPDEPALVVAHRGAWNPAPQNSLAAFEQAIVDGADALGIVPAHPTTTITRTILAGDRLAALAHDMVHPDVPLPDTARLRALLLGGETMFEVLGATETAPAVSRTRISSLMLHPCDSLGGRLGVTEPSACLVLEGVLLGEHGQPLLYSWDVVLPGMIEIEVLRSTKAAPPEPITIRDDGLAPSG